jgi:hypothetical protein
LPIPRGAPRRRASVSNNPFDRQGHAVDIGHPVDAGDDPARFVDRQDRRSLGTVFGHAGTHGFLVVVGPALELVAAALVAGSRDLGRREAVVITLAAGGAGEPADDAFHERVFVHLKLDHMVERAAPRSQQFVERSGLGGGTRIAVEDRADARPHGIELFADQCRDDGIGHQLAAVHHRLGLDPDGRSRLDRGAQHVSGRKLAQAMCLDQSLRLGTLARPRRP